MSTHFYDGIFRKSSAVKVSIPRDEMVLSTQFLTNDVVVYDLICGTKHRDGIQCSVTFRVKNCRFLQTFISI